MLDTTHNGGGGDGGEAERRTLESSLNQLRNEWILIFLDAVSSKFRETKINKRETTNEWTKRTQTRTARVYFTNANASSVPLFLIWYFTNELKAFMVVFRRMDVIACPKNAKSNRFGRCSYARHSLEIIRSVIRHGRRACVEMNWTGRKGKRCERAFATKCRSMEQGTY